MVPWWGPRPSKPLRGVKSVLGVFDSHTPPPFEFSNPPMAGFSFASKPNLNDAGLIGASPLAVTQKARNASFPYPPVHTLPQSRRRPVMPTSLFNKTRNPIRKEALRKP